MLAGGTIVANDTSSALAREVLYPRRWYLVWPAFRLIQHTIGSLPLSIRQAYGFEWRARYPRVGALDEVPPKMAALPRVANNEASATTLPALAEGRA